MLANPIATKRPKNHENHFVKEIVAFTLSPNLAVIGEAPEEIDALFFASQFLVCGG